MDNFNTVCCAGFCVDVIEGLFFKSIAVFINEGYFVGCNIPLCGNGRVLGDCGFKIEVPACKVIAGLGRNNNGSRCLVAVVNLLRSDCRSGSSACKVKAYGKLLKGGRSVIFNFLDLCVKVFNSRVDCRLIGNALIALNAVDNILNSSL